MCQMQHEIVEMKGENTTWQHTLKTTEFPMEYHFTRRLLLPGTLG